MEEGVAKVLDAASDGGALEMRHGSKPRANMTSSTRTTSNSVARCTVVALPTSAPHNPTARRTAAAPAIAHTC